MAEMGEGRSTRFFAGIAVAVLAVAGYAVARQIDASARDEYAALIDEHPGRPAEVLSTLVTKQDKLIVHVLLDGVDRRVDVTRGSGDEVRVGSTVRVHADPSDPSGPLAIAGTETWTWWGAMTQVFGAGAAVAVIAGVWFVAVGPARRRYSSRSGRSSEHQRAP